MPRAKSGGHENKSYASERSKGEENRCCRCQEQQQSKDKGKEKDQSESGCGG